MDDGTVEEISDGAVLQENGIVEAVGKYEEARQLYGVGIS